MENAAQPALKWQAKRHHDLCEAGMFRHLHRVRVGYILDRIAQAKADAEVPLRVLDAGCGDGVLTRRIRDRFPGEVIDALDIDEVRLERARAYCDGVTFRQGDVCAIPYGDGIFDVLLLHHVIEHVLDDRRVLLECCRVLKPGGLLILGIPHEGGLLGRLTRRLHRRLYAEGEHIHFYVIPDMQRLLAETGFRAVGFAKFGFLFPQYWLNLLLLWNPLTFRLGHVISQRVDLTADSLIFTARRAA